MLNINQIANVCLNVVLVRQLFKQKQTLIIQNYQGLFVCLFVLGTD